MSGPTQYFILVYDLELRSVDVHEYGDNLEQANAAYSVLEDQFAGHGEHEIVLVGADSIETIKRTHSPYFSTGSAAEVVEAFIASIK
jgi:hypothetical protein